ncbi:MAG: hypothetical protein JRK26_06565 [Deltaproteobacteria bacterium]|nr:hypothetical protein [Deltaproteobacteria bacterium]
MKVVSIIFLFMLVAGLACSASENDNAIPGQAAGARPAHFPQRIWAACDFELSRKDVVWIGHPEKKNIPAYPGNRSALRARAFESGGRPKYLAIKPVSCPRMGKENRVCFRYFIKGAHSLTLQLFSLDSNRIRQVRLTGLVPGEWSEATADFTQAGGGPVSPGERMNDLVIIAAPEGGAGECELVVDDVILFSNDNEDVPIAEEPFPRRVISVWGFDPVEEYHPWTHTDYQILRKGDHLENDWGACRALQKEAERFKRIRLIIDPPQAVGESTRLRFRYYARGAARVQAMIFDLTDRDNRHIVLENPVQETWQTVTLDFTAHGIKNNGNQTPFEPGSLVDDIFFLAWPAPGKEVELLIDDLVLYDAGP